MEEEPRTLIPVPTSLAQIDAEIDRVTSEIVRIQGNQILKPIVEKETEPPNNARMPIFHDLPDIQNIEIPLGYKRAPISVSVDPEKATRLAALETELRQRLDEERGRDVNNIMRKIRSHQAQNPLRVYRPCTTPSKPTLFEDKQLLAYLVPEYSIRHRT